MEVGRERGQRCGGTGRAGVGYGPGWPTASAVTHRKADPDGPFDGDTPHTVLAD